MLRVTLEADPGRDLVLPFGYEVAVPMHFGTIKDPNEMVDFSGPREALPAERKEYHLSWDDEDMRSVLMEEYVAIHYFGNPMAKSRDFQEVRDGLIPEFNQERLRVARVWGDYLYSDAHGIYTSIRIRVPDVPRVMIVPVGQNGLATPGGMVYRPHEKWKFEELLSIDAEAELAALAARRPKFAPASAQQIDLANLTPEQVEALAAQLAKFSGNVNFQANQEAFKRGEIRPHRERVANGG